MNTRKREIDIQKGILTIGMILCHCIQFFGKEEYGLQKNSGQSDQFISVFGIYVLFWLHESGSILWKKLEKQQCKDVEECIAYSDRVLHFWHCVCSIRGRENFSMEICYRSVAA